ncbi:MAG TPA: hypothetical protein VIY69_12095, partial [Candidatus Acidoferrales bacterium]
IDWDGSTDALQFVKDAEGALVASASPSERLVEAAAANSDGRRLAFPAPTLATAEGAAGARIAPAAAQRPIPTEEGKKK